MSTYQTIYGIDVSQSTLDIVELNGSTEQFCQVDNTTKGILTWLDELCCKQTALFVLEPTGCYSNRLLHYLDQRQMAVSLVNPNQSSAFAQVLGIISKDDRQAARCLALMGQRLDLTLYLHKDDDMQRRKQLLMGINALKKQKQMLRNQLHALDNQIVFEPKVVQALQQTLSTVEDQLQVLEQELGDLSDEEHQQQFKLITSVVGIGPKTAHLLLCATGGLQHFKFARQLSKFAGVVPFSHISGSSIHIKGRMTKKGNRGLRASLYMAARSAKKYNLACKALYERLRKIGKPHKQAMVAVMNKLLRQAFGVVQAGVSFDNQYFKKFLST